MYEGSPALGQHMLCLFLHMTYIMLQMERMKNFDFDDWRKRYMRWMNHNKSRIMDFFRKQDRDRDGKVTRQEFIDGILASSKFYFYIPLNIIQVKHTRYTYSHAQISISHFTQVFFTHIYYSRDYKYITFVNIV